MIRCTLNKSLRTATVAASSIRLASTYTRSSLSLLQRHQQQQQQQQSLRPVAFSRVNLIRSYSAGPAPLTKEFALERIVGLLESYDKVPESKELSLETDFSKDLGLDSLDVVEVVLAIEEEFSIMIPDHEADEIKTIGQAVEFILKQPDAL